MIVKSVKGVFCEKVERLLITLFEMCTQMIPACAALCSGLACTTVFYGFLWKKTLKMFF